MTMLVEDGSGVIGANSYAPIAFVTSYLSDRARATDWSAASTADQEAALIAATDYVEARFGSRFKGLKQYSSLSSARSVLTLTAQPSPGDTVTLGSTTYTFDTQVTIGDTIAETLDNLATYVNAVDTEVELAAFYGLAVVAIALTTGEDGNSIAVSTDVSGASWSFATLNGGNDAGRPQPLSFPRAALYDRDGIAVLGVPPLLKQAVAEYASRALSTALLPDPTVDDSGRAVVRARSKVGPIEEETEYERGRRADLLRSYPAADAMLREYLRPGGRVTRG